MSSASRPQNASGVRDTTPLGHGSKIAAVRERAVLAMLSERTLGAAAKTAGVAERTLRRWLTDDDAFKASLAEARRTAFEAGLSRVQAITAKAIDTLEDLLRKGEQPSVRLGAARAVVELAASRGAVVHVQPDRIGIHPLGVLTADEHAALQAARADRPAITHALLWRVAAMRHQIPPRPQPIPFLVARPDVPCSTGGCVSCGDPRPPGHDARCGLCALAAWVALGDAQTPVVP